MCARWRRRRGAGAGGGAPASCDGDADHATFAGPVALALDEAQTRLFVVDGDTDAVRCIVLPPPAPSADSPEDTAGAADGHEKGGS